MKKALNDTKEALYFSFILAFITILTSGIVMYYIERDIQPEVFSNIPKAIWWAVATLTTVGYGDMVPLTALGRIVASIISLIGIGLVAIPSALISGAYIEQNKK